MNDTSTAQDPIVYGFLLVPNFSMLAFTSAVEPLRMANQLTGRELYRWPVSTLDGEAVAASNGLRIVPEGTLPDLPAVQALFVCGGNQIHRACSKELFASLRKLANRKIPLGALCTGSYLLAKADLLNGYRSTIHWENMASVREEFPGLIVSSELFEIDRDRYTCSGGVAPLDMMLHLIGQQLLNLVIQII